MILYISSVSVIFPFTFLILFICILFIFCLIWIRACQFYSFLQRINYFFHCFFSIVEGCLTNLYRFIALILNQTTDKDYAATYKLNPLCEILNKNSFNKLTDAVNIIIRNATNHGGIGFKEDGQKIDANSLCPCGSEKKFKKCCRGKGIFD